MYITLSTVTCLLLLLHKVELVLSFFAKVDIKFLSYFVSMRVLSSPFITEVSSVAE